MASCDGCGVKFTRLDNLKRHQKFVCKSSSDVGSHPSCQINVGSKHLSKIDRHEDFPSLQNGVDSTKKMDIIPTFDGDEFSGKEPLTRETLIKIMNMLNIPEEEREPLIESELKLNRELAKKHQQADLMKTIKMHTEEEKDDEEEYQEESSKQDDVVQNTSIKNGEFRDYISNNHSDSEEEEEMETDSLPSGAEQVDFIDSSSNNMKHPVIVKASHLTTKVKELVNRFSRLFQEMKANGKDNAEELYILLDELEENGTFTREDCQKAFNAIEDIHNKLSN